jgi:hypothetical protein
MSGEPAYRSLCPLSLGRCDACCALSTCHVITCLEGDTAGRKCIETSDSSGWEWLDFKRMDMEGR